MQVSFEHIIPIIKLNPIYLENRSSPVLFCSWLFLEHTHTHTHTHTQESDYMMAFHPNNLIKQWCYPSGLMVASSECSSSDDLNSPLNLTSPHSPILGHPSFRTCSDSLSSFFLPQRELQPTFFCSKDPILVMLAILKQWQSSSPNAQFCFFFFSDT